MFYESGSGDPRYVRDVNGTVRLVHRRVGAQGVTTVAEAAGPLEERDRAEAIEHYPGGKTRYWRWGAPTREHFSSGFVGRPDVLRVLDMSPKYNMFGFGEDHSGLKRIEPGQFDELLEIFKRQPPDAPLAPRGRQPAPGMWTEGSEEGPDHLLLKEYVAANASAVLGERGVTTHAVEFPFGTCDRADIVLKDGLGRVVGVEVEIAQHDGQLNGLLQAIKYRHMLAVLFRQRFDEARSLLVAYSLAPAIKQLCDDYAVRWVEVDRREVQAWEGARRDA